MSLSPIFRAFLCLHSQFWLFEYLTACQLKELLCCIPKWMLHFCPYRSGKKSARIYSHVEVRQPCLYINDNRYNEVFFKQLSNRQDFTKNVPLAFMLFHYRLFVVKRKTRKCHNIKCMINKLGTKTTSFSSGPVQVRYTYFKSLYK